MGRFAENYETVALPLNCTGVCVKLGVNWWHRGSQPLGRLSRSQHLRILFRVDVEHNILRVGLLRLGQETAQPMSNPCDPIYFSCPRETVGTVRWPLGMKNNRMD